jgi:hypothetical protein
MGQTWHQAVALLVGKLAENGTSSQHTVVIIDADDCQLSQQDTNRLHAVETATTLAVNDSSNQQLPGAVPALNNMLQQCEKAVACIGKGHHAAVLTASGNTAGIEMAAVCATCRSKQESCTRNMPECTGHHCSLFERLVTAGINSSCKVVALVQNVHFLPCGPSGTSHRTAGLLQVCWGSDATAILLLLLLTTIANDEWM